jgi:hypothetical protein
MSDADDRSMRRVGRAAAGHTTLCLNRCPVDTRLFRSSSDGLARRVTGEERDRMAGGLTDTLIIEDGSPSYLTWLAESVE